MAVKIENFRGSRYLVARENTKTIAYKKFNKDTHEQDLKTFRKNNTFKPNESQTKLVNVREKKRIIFDSNSGKRYNVRNPSRYQYGFMGLTASGIEIHARSQLKPKDFPQDKARAEALENFYYRISFEFSKNTNYDSSEGKTAFDNGYIIKTEEYIVNYVKV
jgi:hypothetical protein